MKSELVKEVWKPVPGCEVYEVSSFGRGRSLNYNHTGKIKLLSPKKECNGYMRLCLFKHGVRKYYSVHRLVYEAFIGPIPDGMQVNHINEIKTDNFVFVNPDGSVDLKKSNLNLMTPKENMNWGSCQERAHIKQINHPNMSKPVYQYTLDGVLVRVWPSIKEAQRNGFNQGGIWSCCHGKCKQYKGFLWSYTPLN